MSPTALLTTALVNSDGMIPKAIHASLDRVVARASEGAIITPFPIGILTKFPSFGEFSVYELEIWPKEFPKLGLLHQEKFLATTLLDKKMDVALSLKYSYSIFERLPFWNFTYAFPKHGSATPLYA